MKILSDKSIKKHLIGSLTKEKVGNEYLPVLQRALADYEANPAVVPERTVLTSNYPGCDTTHLFMPCAAPDSVGTKVISGGSYNSKKGLGFQGFTGMLDPRSGELLGVVNAKSLTAFRTALASFSVVWKEFDVKTRPNIDHVTVFGTGPQAFWHVFLVLRVYQVQRVTVVSRSQESAQKLCDEIKEVDGVKTEALALSSGEVGDRVRNSEVIFGCVPSTEPTIKEEYLDTTSKKLIVLIGSYKPHMVELDPKFVEKSFRGEYKIIVDSKTHALSEAGELVQSGSSEENLVSLNDYLTEKAQGKTTTKSGITVAKIVGLSIMDIYMAQYMLDAVDAPSVDFD
ncbi:hypothetical protein FT663_03354 [Candidozyma haemuli var. vulneris]|uniref:Ornithine cyclodeaminase n=1 Tax=Candidozyma haemuli TaxID=45357 RepID=A0A2V1B0Q5_9ASCO|nr:hypothetical protein CXQ85_003894 [[Candida] haemuloni]KAF3989130.1 hypothetical protein FT662_03026 [[Candida] haemuloni var. vulneris]KAF3990066.1 hypothetical protein FT663_03354 [[Candida] haemuloni var. vulneris]PVH23604.1 hypothetical protein CXQ85_003894 [[Candida] haemuloni]